MQGVAGVLAWSVIVTFAIAKATAFLVSARAKPEAEVEGLAMHVHGERAWHDVDG